MEIREWISSLGDRARLLVIIPLVAGSLAALVTLIGPSPYASSATVIVAEDPTAGSITAVAAQRVSDLLAAVRSEGVLDQVANELDIARGDLEGITVERAGSSGVVSVSYSSQRSEEVAIALEAVVRTALRVIAQARVDVAGAEAEAARAAFDDASTELSEAQKESGEVFTEFALIDFARRYRDRQDEANAAIAAGNTAQANELKETLEALARKLERLQYLRGLDARVSASLESLSAAESRLSQAEGALRAADSQEIAVSIPARQSKLREAARRFFFVGAVGLVLAVALVLLLQLIDRRRGSSDIGTDAQGGPLRRPAA